MTGLEIGREGELPGGGAGGGGAVGSQSETAGSVR
jgi:hypothetical protein